MNTELYKYFREVWQPNQSSLIYSGFQLVKKIKPRETILDVGCGYNSFKQYFGGRLYGIDPANNAADEVVSIEDFQTNKIWDVAFCLGSLNFGTEENVYPQVEKVCKLAKRIYWRQNPGLQDHPWKGVENITFFPWSFELNYELANKHNFIVNQIEWDNGNRIYAEWIAQ